MSADNTFDLALERTQALFRFIRRSLWWMVAPAVVLGLTAAFYLSGIKQEVYQTTAILVVGQASGKGVYRVPVLAKTGYLQLLRSTPVMAALRRRAEAEGWDVAQADLRPGRAVSAEIQAARRGQRGNTSLVELTARAQSPETAAAMSNAWANLFIQADARQMQITALDKLLNEARDRLTRSQTRIETLGIRAQVLTEQRAEMSPTIRLRKVLSDAELLRGRGQQVGTELISDEPNPTYVRLGTILAEHEANLRIETRLAEDAQAERAAVEAEIARIQAIRIGREDEAEPPAPTLATVQRIRELDGAVRWLEPAVAPELPEPSAAVPKALLAALGGVILGLLAAAIRELGRETSA